ncbi:MAG TPA: hypothetical protein VMU85_11790 [Stellaceae bacterium]|nr:hypothetical protein [Stellaceae bacterium]
MLGKAILMTAHALGIVTILGCALMARQSLSPAAAVARLVPTDPESGSAVLARGGR